MEGTPSYYNVLLFGNRTILHAAGVEKDRLIEPQLCHWTHLSAATLSGLKLITQLKHCQSMSIIFTHGLFDQFILSQLLRESNLLTFSGCTADRFF